MKQGIKSIEELYQHLEEQRENRKMEASPILIRSATGLGNTV